MITCFTCCIYCTCRTCSTYRILPNVYVMLISTRNLRKEKFLFSCTGRSITFIQFFFSFWIYLTQCYYIFFSYVINELCWFIWLFGTVVRKHSIIQSYCLSNRRFRSYVEQILLIKVPAIVTSTEKAIAVILTALLMKWSLLYTQLLSSLCTI